MEVDEVVRRVGVAYWPLLLALVIAGLAGAAALHYNDRPIYTSDVRFVLDAPDPRAASESGAIADTAKSIATSPSNVADALAKAGVQRDVEQFATRNIELQPLGTSGVMDLQVKDTDRVAAAAIANALAATVLSTRAAVNETQARLLIASLAGQIKTLDANIAQLDTRIARYRGISPDPSTSAAALSGLYSERASLAQERLTLETQINQINQSLAMRPQSGVISAAEPASRPDASRAPIDMALGGLGGFVVGIIVAALLATLRPQIRGPREIARMLEAPVLGDFDRLQDGSEAALTARIRIAATRAGVKQVQLVPLNGSDEALNLVNVLIAKLGPPLRGANAPVPLNGNGQAVSKIRKPHSTIAVTPFDPSALSKNGNAADTGLILLAPNVLVRQDLDASANLLTLTGCPVAGIVTYVPRSGRGGGRRGPRHAYAARGRLTDPESMLDPFGYG